MDAWRRAGSTAPGAGVARGRDTFEASHVTSRPVARLSLSLVDLFYLVLTSSPARSLLVEVDWWWCLPLPRLSSFHGHAPTRRARPGTGAMQASS